MKTVLETNRLLKTFGGLTAVDRVTLSVQEGEIFGIIGPNGAGKTTFLNSISGALKPDGGKVVFMGEETTGASAFAMCQRGMARTFQISQPFPKMTALENVMVSATFGHPGGSHGDPEEIAREMLEYVEFPLPVYTPARNLNTVQLKRLDLARALASKPQLLLLDELAAGLATGELGDLMDIIRKIRDNGVTIIMIEHIMRVIMGLCDRLAVIYYGAKIAEGPTKEVAQDPKVAEAYLGEEFDL
ncbi:MAG TPA: ABC transporter ATP-binding protein [Candidatus Sulfomarinibacteraceae bacterium]|nr:ABC transporter ATP-binding protein [Candidatus Sulfomarinibacteraceae bacterium]